jgi:type V secretory pathway adhesin AidA
MFPNEHILSRLHAYGLANVYYEFMGDTGVTVDGIDLQDNNDEVWGELAAGLTYWSTPTGASTPKAATSVRSRTGAIAKCCVAASACDTTGRGDGTPLSEY